MTTLESVDTSPGTTRPRHERYRSALVAVSFVLLLLLPTLDQVLNLSGGFESTEKRILTPIPTFRFPHVRTFIAEYNQYYKENFGWRNALFYQYSHWKYYVMGVSPLPEKVVVGKNGWFYPGNSMSRVADQHQGFSTLPPATIQSIAARLTDYQRQLAGQGTKLYVFFAPDSYSIYPETVPDNFRLLSGPTNFDRVKRYLRTQTTIPLIDCRADLIRAKTHYMMYRQTDTHWSDMGALIATFSIANYLRNDFPAIPAATLAEYELASAAGNGGDLTTMLALNRELVDSVAYRVKPAVSVQAKEIERYEQGPRSLPDLRFANPDITRPKLFLQGDSFTFSMNQFLPGFFRESLVVNNGRFDLNRVKREKPDILVIEIAERNIAFLADL